MTATVCPNCKTEDIIVLATSPKGKARWRCDACNITWVAAYRPYPAHLPQFNQENTPSNQKNTNTY